MKKQYYFKHNDSEFCHNKDYFIEYMQSSDLKEIEVYIAEPEIIYDVFWCKYLGFCGDDSSDTCGKQCSYYLPRNGKNGCCKHHTNRLYMPSNKTTLKL